jgi:FdrA protein
MTEQALDLLERDGATETVVVVSKPPDEAVARRIAERARALHKPVILAFLGSDGALGSSGNVLVVDTLEAAAAAAAERSGAVPYSDPSAAPERAGSGYLRGFFCGGTLCDEAMAIAAAQLGPIASNIPLEGARRLADSGVSEGHTFVDYGDDEFTEGRAHPMIDPSLRAARVAREAADPEVGAILVDVVLGHGAHADPAEPLAAAFAEGRAGRAEPPALIVSLCGTQDDPQGLEGQRARLEEAGAVVARSNAHAARLALAAVGASAVSA